MGKKIAAILLGVLLGGGIRIGGSHAAGDAVSTMVAIKGKTIIERNRAERLAKVKDDVLLIDTVATLEAAKAKMLFIDDSVLTLGEKSKVIIKEYVYSKENGGKSIFNLLDGKMKAVVGKARFEVHTPTAVAAARGTVILIETGIRNGVPFTDVISLEGEVVVTPKAPSGGRGGGPGRAESEPTGGGAADGASEIVLTQGNIVTVTPGDPLPLPAAASPPVLAGFFAATESVSFEMPVPSFAEFSSFPAVESVRTSTSAGSSPTAAPASGDSSSHDAAFQADHGIGNLPPIPQQPFNATSTHVHVNVTFP